MPRRRTACSALVWNRPDNQKSEVYIPYMTSEWILIAIRRLGKFGLLLRFLFSFIGGRGAWSRIRWRSLQDFLLLWYSGRTCNAVWRSNTFSKTFRSRAL